jgi:hypothetical protein
MDDASLRKRLIAGGLNTVAARYDWSVVLPEYRKLLGLSAER